MNAERFDELLDAYLDGTLTPDAGRELAVALREPQWQAAARDYAHLQGALNETLKAAHAPALTVADHAQPARQTFSRKALAIAAVVALAVGVFVAITVLRGEPGSGHTVTAMLGEKTPVTLTSDGRTQVLAVGLNLPAAFSLESSPPAGSANEIQATLKLWGKAAVQIAPNSRLDVRIGDAPTIELRAGQLRIDSSELTQAGRQLCIKTRFADVRTEGTRFNVLVEADQVRVFVEEGRVAVSNQFGTQRVTANHETFVRLNAAPAAPAQLALAELHATFKAEKGRIITVAFSSDGRTLATGNSERQVRMLRIPGGEELPTKFGPPEPVKCVAFSPRQRRVAACDGSGNVRLWDVDSGAELNAISRHTGVICVAFSPDGKTLAAGEQTGLVTLWDLETGKARVVDRHADPVLALAFSPSGTLLAAGNASKTVRVWDVQTGAPLKTFSDHGSAVTAVAFSPDGAKLAVGLGVPVMNLWSHTTVPPQFRTPRELAEAIALWDVSSGRKIASFPGTEHSISSLLFLPDGQTLVSGSVDAKLAFRDVTTQALLTVLTDHSALIRSLAVSPDGRMLASGSHDGTVRLWNLIARKQ